MKKLLHSFPLIIILGGYFVLAGCTKKKDSPQISAVVGSGSYTFNGTMYATGDTLSRDPFSGGKCVTMKPTVAKNDVIVYNVPSLSSGSVNFSDATNPSSSAPYIIGNSSIGSIFYSSVANSGSITKTGATSFSFSCTVSDESNPANTYKLSGSGTY